MKNIHTLLCLCSLSLPALARADDAQLTSGIELYHKGEFEASIRALDAAIAATTDRAARGKAQLFRGLSQAVLGQWPDARQSFEGALTDDPEVVIDRERVRPAIVAAFDEVHATVVGQLEVVSSTRALVLVDGTTAGPTPLVGKWPVGRHSVVVRTEDQRQQYVREDLLFRADEPVRIVAILAPRFGKLELRTHPAGADVSLGDRIIGRAPLDGFPMPAGAATVMVRMPGYQDERVEVMVPPEDAVSVDVVLKLAPASATLADAPMWGPDLREEVDPWTANIGLGVGGMVPLAASVQTADPSQLGVSGGADLGLEIGVSVFDLVEVSAVGALVTYGPDVAYFSKVLAEPGAQTDFVFHEGISGSLHMRLARLGVEGRVTVGRFGRLRPYVGFGGYAMPAVGAITSVAPPTSRVDDSYAIRAELGATSVAPLLGFRWTLWEYARRGSYMAVDLICEGRLDVMSWDTPIIEVGALSAEGLERGTRAGERWTRALEKEGSSVTGGLTVALGVRL